MADLNEAGKKFMEKEAARMIIKGYLAIKKVQEEKNYGDEMIARMYGILPFKYKDSYNFLDPELKKEIEEEIQKQIEEGSLDLDRYLVEMYKKRKGRDGEER